MAAYAHILTAYRMLKLPAMRLKDARRLRNHQNHHRGRQATHCSCNCQEHSTAARNAAEPSAGRASWRSLLCSSALSEAAMSAGTAVPAPTPEALMTVIIAGAWEMHIWHELLGLHSVFQGTRAAGSVLPPQAIKLWSRPATFLKRLLFISGQIPCARTSKRDAIQEDLPGQEYSRHISLRQGLLREACSGAQQPRQLADQC